MGNILQDMMGLLSRKKVVKEMENNDHLVLGRTNGPEGLSGIFSDPKMDNRLITFHDFKREIEFDNGLVEGSGTTNQIPLWSDGPALVLGDSKLRQRLSGSGAYQLIFDEADRMIINRPSTITGGDPEYLIQQDGNYKASFGWDDDGGGFAFLFNWAGKGIRLGHANENPIIEITDDANPGKVEMNALTTFQNTTATAGIDETPVIRFLGQSTPNDAYEEGARGQIVFANKKRKYGFTGSADIGKYEGVVALTNDSRSNDNPSGFNNPATTVLALYNTPWDASDSNYFVAQIGRVNIRANGNAFSEGGGAYKYALAIKGNGDIHTGWYNGTNCEVPARTLYIGNVQFGSDNTIAGDKGVLIQGTDGTRDAGLITVYNADSVSNGIEIQRDQNDTDSGNDRVNFYFEGAGQGAKFLISRKGTAGPEIELQANGDINLNRNSNGIVNIHKALRIGDVPAYADDAAAGAAGRVAGDVFQTDGTAASPLNVAGILMVKQ